MRRTAAAATRRGGVGAYVGLEGGASRGSRSSRLLTQRSSATYSSTTAGPRRSTVIGNSVARGGTKTYPSTTRYGSFGNNNVRPQGARATNTNVNGSSQLAGKTSDKRSTRLVAALISGVAAGCVIYVYYNGATFVVTAEEVPNKQRPRIVILGSGWGAMSLVKELEKAHYDVTIVSPRNYFLFTPLLPSVTSGTLEPKTVIEPIRRYCNRVGQTDVSFYEASCTSIDPVKKTVTCQVNLKGIAPEKREFTLPYDKLVVAVGAVNNTFGTPGVEQNCIFLKELSDAISIRNRLLDCLELASLPGQSEEDKKQLLHFVVVGGGPTGVEVAGECVDFIKDNVEKWYPQLKPYVKITLLELLDHILSTYDAKISAYCESHFKRENIDLRTKSRVVKVAEKAVHIKRTDNGEEEAIPFGMCVWSTGVGVSPLVSSLLQKLPAEHQTNRRALLTDAHLRVKGADGIYALGDCATISQDPMLAKFSDLFRAADENGDGVLSYDEFDKLIRDNKKRYPQLEMYGKLAREMFEEADVNKNGVLELHEFEALLKKVDSKLKQLPATAQVARQEGIYLAKIFNEQARGRAVDDFAYRHMGSLVSLGAQNAVAEFANSTTLEGFSAWWLWRSVYLSRQYSLKNKILVAANWVKTAIFGRDLTRN